MNVLLGRLILYCAFNFKGIDSLGDAEYISCILETNV